MKNKLLIFFGIFVLSFLITVLIPIVGLIFGNYDWGFPFEWSSFGLWGSETDYQAFYLDVLFWYLVLLIIGWVFRKLKN